MTIRKQTALYRHEMKINLKTLCVWSLSVGLLCFGCILLYTSLEDSIQEIASSFSDLGAMSAALGMDKMSLATLTGYYATEIAMMHGLGGAMFAAILGSGLLSKEESGHTTDFLYVLPISRGHIVRSKYLALVSHIVIFNLFCAGLYLFGLAAMGEDVTGREMLLFHCASTLMQIEIGSVCFLLSACVKKNLPGAGIGIAILLFGMDMMCRIVPAIEDLKYITPFYYANAADIFSNGKTDAGMVLTGALLTIGCGLAAWGVCERKDF